MKGHVFIISTNDRDRHGSRLNINGWKLDNYRLNPIVHWMEPALFTEDNPDEVIGTSEVWIENHKLYAEWKPDLTSEIARKIERKLKAGTSLGASVNFIPLSGSFGKGAEAEGGKRETYYYSRQELLSWKICAIPSNPDCIYHPHYKGDRGAKAKMISRRMKLMELEVKHNAVR